MMTIKRVNMSTLNKSLSKQKFSFGKSPRFHSESKHSTDSMYNLPSLFSSRSTTFGYGNKDIGMKYQKKSPSPEAYRIISQFDNRKKGYSFGESRQDVQITGPFSDRITKNYIPSPNTYNPKLQSISPKITIKQKLKDHSLQQILKVKVYLWKNPGPGAYNLQQIGSSNYYIQSKHSNKINYKISRTPRPDTLLLQNGSNPNVGPGSYDLKCTQLNNKGQYLISSSKNSMARKFSKQPRPNPAIRHLLYTPGPNTYQRVSQFDN